MKKLITVLLFSFCATSSFAADPCSSKLNNLAKKGIKADGFKPDETFTFEVEPLLLKEKLNTYRVNGVDQTGPTVWIMVLTARDCKIDYFKRAYQE